MYQRVKEICVLEQKALEELIARAKAAADGTQQNIVKETPKETKRDADTKSQITIGTQEED